VGGQTIDSRGVFPKRPSNSKGDNLTFPGKNPGKGVFLVLLAKTGKIKRCQTVKKEKKLLPSQGKASGLKDSFLKQLKRNLHPKSKRV